MSVFDHFRPEERPLIEHFLDLKEQTTRRFTSRITDFLDPREQFILNSVIGQQDDVQLLFSGGYPGAERQRALLLPPYADDAEETFDIACLEVDYPSKFATLSHPQLLGSILGTGVDRRKIGDLLFVDGRALFLCARDVEAYLTMTIDSVGRQKVALHPIEAATLPKVTTNWIEETGTVSSLRLDTVLSEIYHLSRSKVSEQITHGLVKVNWQAVEKRDFMLAAGDMLSLRGFGRSKILSADGLTKKNKIRLVYGKLD
ncbi:RNA-binding protein [Sporolactobacillus spathodeae]|uniref:RNA-binding protein YlmH n=1 Tax=Sporolactobacillus spathodeae TaxID=1465502 RepID=A0ABS2Q9D9_9BACL|nr:YlmH/Sll1252 family protein [Sporolactobacillus spathodeae]MBM7658276.1 RNA-binding protein YlmH [Sporolactobacillus spathodeae]